MAMLMMKVGQGKKYQKKVTDFRNPNSLLAWKVQPWSNSFLNLNFIY